jgi:hypothetical protein
MVLLCQPMGKGQAARQEESLGSTSQVFAAKASVKLYIYPTVQYKVSTLLARLQVPFK